MRGEHGRGRKPEMLKPLPALCLADGLSPAYRVLLPQKHTSESLCTDREGCVIGDWSLESAEVGGQ